MEIVKCMGCMEEYRGYPCPYCGYDPKGQQKTSFLLPPETILGGKYLIGKMLGQGGFGITYIGWDIALERKVAIKEYYPSGQVSRMPGTRSLVWSESEQARAARLDGMQMFLKEARKMAKLEEIPGVVKIRDLFQENDTAYIVMDFVEGKTLKETLKRSGPMSWDRARPLFLSAIRAMKKVHASGLIHRDLSPDNLMLTPEGDVKILDLGAAKDLSINSGASSMQVAKGGFSPYEQYTQRGGSGPWTDVYAMAATIYYTLTGKVPPTAIDRVTEDTISWDCPGLLDLPAPALNALKKAMAVLPKQRTQSMAGLEQGLLGFSKPDPIPIPHPTPKPAPKPQRKAWILAAAVLLLAALFLVFPDGGSKSSPSEPTAASGKAQKTITPDVNWEETVDRIMAAGTQDVYNYQNGAKLEMYFDGDNEVARVFTNEQGTAEYVFKACYDDNGKLLEQRGYDGSGTLMRREVYTFNADGEILEHIVYGQNDKQTDKWVYTYDSQGRDESSTHFNSAFQRDQWCTYTYDASGRKLATWEYLDGSTSFTRFNAEDEVVEYGTRDANGKQKYRGTYRYDSNGNRIEWCYYDSDDNLSSKTVDEFIGDRRVRGTDYSYFNSEEHVSKKEYLYTGRDVNIGYRYTSDEYNYTIVYEDVKDLQDHYLRVYSKTDGQYNSGTGISYYSWDSNYLGHTSYKEDGSVQSESVYHYDDYGNDLGHTYTYHNSYKKTTEVTEYDADGNQLSKKTYDSSGKLIQSE